MLRYFAAVAMLMASSSIAYSGRAPDKWDKFESCVFYTKSHFDPGAVGVWYSLRSGDKMESLPKDLDNKISSVLCAPECTGVGYLERDFKGAFRVFRGATLALKAKFNDKISSIGVSCVK